MVAMSNTLEGGYNVIVLPDCQVPFHDRRAIAAVEKYMAEYKWDEYINLGDFLDFDQISKFNEDSFRNIEGRRLRGDFYTANEIILRHQAILQQNNPKCKMTFLEGNHEYRVERFIDKFPVLEGLLEVETNLMFKELGIKYVRCYSKGEIYKIGKAYFHHGLYATQNHAKKMVDNFGVNIFYGHVHDVQSYTKVAFGKNKTLVGHSLGCLCTYEQSYIGKNPKNWQHAFAVFHFQPNGFFNYYVVKIFNGKFIGPDGKTYEA